MPENNRPPEQLSERVEKVEMLLQFANGDGFTVRANPDWLREFVMTNSWCAIGSGQDEIWINGAHIATVTRVKDRSF